MPSLALAFPVLPGKKEAGLRFAEEVGGARRAEHDRVAEAYGVTREEWFLQSTPEGDMVVVFFEAPDPWGELAHWATADSPYEKWFVAQVRDITGVDLAQPAPEPFSHSIFAARRR